MARRFKLWSMVFIVGTGAMLLAIIGGGKMNDKSTDEDGLSYAEFLARSMEELRIKTAAHDRLWHLGEADWSVDQDGGTIVFKRQDDVVATCPVQIIGTFNTADSTWLWAWDHPSVQPALRQHAERLRAYGETHGIDRLTTRKLESSEDECWEFAALACKISDAQGAYRGPAGQALVFMTFGQPTLGKASGRDASRDSEPGTEASQTDSVEFTVDMPAEVRQTVTAFIEERYEWEMTTFATVMACKKGEREPAIEQGQSAYEALIQKWCGSDVEASGSSYGSEPTHDPEREEIRDAAMSGDTWVVRTRSTKPSGFASDYEYHLRREGNRWLIKNLFYVADGEKFESL